MDVKSVSIYKAAEEDGFVVYTKLQSGETKKDHFSDTKTLFPEMRFPGERYN